MKLRRRVSAAKPVARMPVDRPKRGDAADHDDGAEQMSQLRDRHRVAVAGRRQRHHRPPQRCRQRAEGARLHVALDHIHRGRRQKQDDQKQREHARQRLCLEHEDAADLGEARRVLRELEHPERREQPRVGAGSRRKQRNRDCDHADEVDKTEKREEMAPRQTGADGGPRAHRALDRKIGEAAPQARGKPAAGRAAASPARCRPSSPTDRRQGRPCGRGTMRRSGATARLIARMIPDRVLEYHADPVKHLNAAKPERKLRRRGRMGQPKLHSESGRGAKTH